jgi:hypothetical protein
MNFKGKWINEYKKSSITFENTKEIEDYNIVYEVNGVIISEGLLQVRKNQPTNDGTIRYGMPHMPGSFGDGGIGVIVVSENRKVITITTMRDYNKRTILIHDSFELKR